MNRPSTLAPPGTRLRLLQFALTAATLLVAGCGGGGSSTPDAPAQAGSPAPAPGPATGPAPVTASTCGLPDFAASVLARVNQVRAAGASCRTAGNFAPAAALSWNTALTQAAEAHSQDMVANNLFSHTGSDGSSAGARISAAGYAWTAYGENIAAGQATVNEVVDGWMASDGHCANIMSATFQDIGVVCVPGTGADTYRTYWTMDLGRP